MKFRVGDVCEILPNPRIMDHLQGLECTVVGIDYGRAGYVSIDVNGVRSTHPSGLWGAEEKDLRLKRPPAWDSWIFDTRDVSTPNKQATPA